MLPETRLLNDLFKDYSRDARPVLNGTQPVILDMKLSLRLIANVVCFMSIKIKTNVSSLSNTLRKQASGWCGCGTGTIFDRGMVISNSFPVPTIRKTQGLKSRTTHPPNEKPFSALFQKVLKLNVYRNEGIKCQL